MLVTKEHIHKIIPQRQPIIMVDTLVSCDKANATTSFEINPDNIFIENGCLNESGLIENIAQTAAAKAGYVFLKKNKPIPIGFIGAIKKVKIQSLPKTGRRLNTIITVLNNIFGVTLIYGKVTCNDILIAECEMKILIVNEEK